MAGNALKVGRVLLYAVWTLPLMALQVVLLATDSRHAMRLPMIYHRVCCRILGFRVGVFGTPSRRRPTLFVANHASYTDITILGALIEGSFVAKSEISKWPFFGWLAKLQRTVFVDRRIRTTAKQRGDLGARLEAGDNLILFPEGTSNDGIRVRPFKSALLSVAERTHRGEPVAVQPVTVAYTRLDGMPIGRLDRPVFAWYGDMDLMPHMWHLLGRGTIAVEVEFHPVVTLGDFASRKALTEHCQRVIAAGLAIALSGRRDAVVTAADPSGAAMESPAASTATGGDGGGRPAGVLDGAP
jgi:1-acyl-sn-glycerol-3-phosphate acyltransferase